MARTTYDIGDVARIAAAYTQNSVAVDPTTVSLTVEDPAGTQTTYTYAGATVTRDSAGNYHVDVAVATAGRYRYRWVSTGTGASAAEGFFLVRPREVAAAS
jgi:hypothetical protein